MGKLARSFERFIREVNPTWLYAEFLEVIESFDCTASMALQKESINRGFN